MKQNFSRPTWNHFLDFGINLWSWPWNYWKVQVHTSPFKKIWDCWIAVRWIEKDLAQLGDNSQKKRRWTIQKKSLHINTVYTEISDILTKIASKNVWENLSWIVQQADLRRLLQVKPVAIAVPGLSTTSSLSSSSGTSLPTSLPQESIGSTPIPALIECESADEQARGDPSRNPTNQAMST